MLDVAAAYRAQCAAEGRGEQPAGHAVKLAALLLHAAARYALWAAGQTPEYVPPLTRPVHTLVDALHNALEAHGDDASGVPGTSYALEPAPLPAAAPRTPWRDAVALARASAALEARLHAALCALQADPPQRVCLAVVHGPSLHFARAMSFWTLDAAIPPPSPSAARDSPASEAQRRKTSALLERKLVRHCMMCEALQGTPVPPGPTRFLLYAPHTLRVPGWTPRAHWNVAPPSEVDAQDDAEAAASDAEDDADAAGQGAQGQGDGARAAQDTPPPRVSRMQLPAALDCRRRARASFQPRAKRVVPQSHLVVHGGLDTAGREARHVWFECEVVVRGVAEFRALA